VHARGQGGVGRNVLIPASLYERLFAAFWLFEDRKSDPSLRLTKGFYANNLAFRADEIRAHLFPQADCYRGQCAAPTRALRAAGTPMHRQGASHVSHPPPDGLSHLLVRAICHGYDTALWRRAKGRSALRNTPISSVLQFFGHVAKLGANIVRHRRRRLGTLGALLAFALTLACYAVKLLGEIVSHFAPRFVRRTFSV
jgi:hypothetical protein